MRKLLLLAFLPVVCVLTTKTNAQTGHVTDGNVSEWNLAKFETDPGNKLLYAADNDENNLYVALKITDPYLQIRLMTHGMSMFIDKKAKQKEGAGIEFPLKKAPQGFFGGRGGVGGGQPGDQPDPKMVRERVGSKLSLLKAFGMENLDEEKNYIISLPNMVNVSFTIDDQNIMYVEYQVPFIFIDNAPALKGKTLNIGWKIEGPAGPPPTSATASTAAVPTTTTTTTTTQVVAVAAGTTPAPSRSRGGPRRSGARGEIEDMGPSDNKSKEPTVWTKYVITL